MSQTVLVIAAHPDDEVLGVGATMAKRAQAGDQVYVVFVATGISARYESPADHQDEINAAITELKGHAKKSADILGVQKIFYLDFPDNRMDTVSRMDVAHAIKKVIQEVQPDVVYTHHDGDYNWDHGIVYDATLMAARANSGDIYPKEIYTYEVLSSTERNFQNGHTVFCPTVFEDVKQTIALKKQAMQCYVSELETYPHPRSPEGIEILAQKRGLEVGLEYAESFALVRSIKE